MKKIVYWSLAIGLAFNFSLAGAMETISPADLNSPCSADDLYSAKVPADLIGKPWVFFDLGNTIVDTHDWKDVHYIRGAVEYLQALRASHFPVGLIINVPESWGKNYQEKFAELQRFMVSDGKWTDPRPFDWSVYDLILLPNKNTDRKPRSCLFAAAGRLTLSKYIYIGEEPSELSIVNALGFHAYSLGSVGSFYLPVQRLCYFMGLPSDCADD